jgi:hypothetical protein
VTSIERPRTAEQWRAYLAGYSADFLRVADPDRLEELGEERRANGWLGFAGAGADALTAVEARLGAALPPGYRAFLEASDGWLELGPFVWTMRTTADVGWLRDIEPEMCDVGDEDDELIARALLVSADADACYWLLDPSDVDEHRGVGGVRLGLLVPRSRRPVRLVRRPGRRRTGVVRGVQRPRGPGGRAGRCGRARRRGPAVGPAG